MRSERIAICIMARQNNGITQVHLPTGDGKENQEDALLLNWHLKPGENYVRGRKYRIVITEIDGEYN